MKCAYRKHTHEHTFETRTQIKREKMPWRACISFLSLQGSNHRADVWPPLHLVSMEPDSVYFACLASFTHCVCVIHPYFRMSSGFTFSHCWAAFLCAVYSVFTRPTATGHLSNFQFGAIVKRAAMNILVYIFGWNIRKPLSFFLSFFLSSFLFFLFVFFSI